MRTKHHGDALADGAALPDFFELITENVFGAGGRPREVLEEARRRRPIALHGVSLSIGSLDPLDSGYLDRVAALVDRVQPAIVSDHLCVTSHGGRHAHDLLPLVFTPAEVDRIAARVRAVQARLGRRILLENVSSYLTWKGSTMTEWAFLAAVADQADAGILLDVNNVFVNARNHGFDAEEYFAGLPAVRVGQIHLAGHADRGRYLFDTHDAPVPDPVWSLYESALARFGAVSTLIERDDKLPPWAELLAEAARARTLLTRAVPVPSGKATPGKVTPGSLFTFSARDGESEDSPLSNSRDDSPRNNSTSPLFDALFRGDAAVLPLIDTSGSLSPAERVAIYSTSYIARLHDALLDDFTATDALLAHERFHAAALDYVRSHPSTSPDLGDFGVAFPALLRAKHPAAGDLAALEWARVESFRAADAPPLDGGRLASLAPGRWASLRFVPHPSLRLIDAAFRVDAAWRAADAGDTPSPPLAEGGSLRVWREGTTVYHAWMEPAEGAALGAIVAGGTFAAAADRVAAILVADPQTAATRLAAYLRDWLTDGVFRAVR